MIALCTSVQTGFADEKTVNWRRGLSHNRGWNRFRPTFGFATSTKTSKIDPLESKSWT